MIRHRIEPMIAPGMAAAYPRQPHDGARAKAVPGNRLVHIGRAAWQITALAPKQQRKAQLIGADQIMRRAAAQTAGIRHRHILPGTRWALRTGIAAPM